MPPNEGMIKIVGKSISSSSMDPQPAKQAGIG
jgi:hypothetical protein